MNELTRYTAIALTSFALGGSIALLSVQDYLDTYKHEIWKQKTELANKQELISKYKSTQMRIFIAKHK